MQISVCAGGMGKVINFHRCGKSKKNIAERVIDVLSGAGAISTKQQILLCGGEKKKAAAKVEKLMESAALFMIYNKAKWFRSKCSWKEFSFQRKQYFLRHKRNISLHKLLKEFPENE